MAKIDQTPLGMEILFEDGKLEYENHKKKIFVFHLEKPYMSNIGDQVKQLFQKEFPKITRFHTTESQFHPGIKILGDITIQESPGIHTNLKIFTNCQDLEGFVLGDSDTLFRKFLETFQKLQEITSDAYLITFYPEQRYSNFYGFSIKSVGLELMVHPLHSSEDHQKVILSIDDFFNEETDLTEKAKEALSLMPQESIEKNFLRMSFLPQTVIDLIEMRKKEKYFEKKKGVNNVIHSNIVM